MIFTKIKGGIREFAEKKVGRENEKQALSVVGLKFTKGFYYQLYQAVKSLSPKLRILSVFGYPVCWSSLKSVWVLVDQILHFIHRVLAPLFLQGKDGRYKKIVTSVTTT